LSQVVFTVDTSARTTLPVAELFGPVIERVVKEAIDLDTGEMPELSSSTNLSFPDAIAENVRQAELKGVDAFAQSSVLLALGLTLVTLQEKSWDLITPQQIKETFAVVLTNQPVRMEMRAGRPGTYAFSTREGGRGILQVLGTVNNPHGADFVKIRYKLVQEENVAGGSTALRTAKTKLWELRQTYGEQHAAVQKQLRVIAALEKEDREHPGDSPEMQEARVRLVELESELGPAH